jgi:hypothetical protein
MPSRSRAPARASSQPRVSTRRPYSADLLASGRRRVEETDEPWRLIALDFSLHPRSMQRLAKRLGWKRPLRPPRKGSTFVKENNGGRPPAYFTPELLTEAQRRVEQTNESTTSIAGKLGMHQSVLWRLIRKKGWVRPEASLRRRGLSRPMQLAAAADALAAGQALDPRVLAAGGDSERTSTVAPAPDDPSAIDRLEQAVFRELATVEAMRASLGNEPARPIDAERTARTLSVLTETLSKLRRMRIALTPQIGPAHDDDMPADPDDFRLDFARRIRAFVASRTGRGNADGDPGPAAVGEAQ